MPRRTAIPISQKIALRAQRQLQPKASNIELARWFKETFQHPIALSSVSEILSSRYKCLDNHLSLHQTNSKRIRIEFWPDLEKALFQWVQQAEGQIIISQEVIREKARFFWAKIPSYQGKDMPSFSNGWLAGFQSRRSIRAYKQHGEEGSVPETASQAMRPIQQLLSTFQPNDIYNCDETSLFWKQVPDRSLSTRSIPGKKKEKARISVLFCCNADGSERLPPCFIGTAKKPRAFTAAGINIENFNCQWYSNRKAWMSGQIFEGWLRWFDNTMSGRKVVLLLDHISAHKAAFEQIDEGPSPLKNTLVIWLPPNSTSHFQPLDQGIIRTWKAYWKRRWVRFILEEYEEGRDPSRSMHVLHAVRWGIEAWEFDLSSKTIQRCFNKALRSEQIQLSEINPIISDITRDFQELQHSSRIRDPMDIDDFINPNDEVVQDNIHEIDDLILSQFQPEIEQEEDEIIQELPSISIKEAIDALERLRLYEEQQPRGSSSFLRELYKHERVVKGRKLANQEQRDIRSYFNV
ncbi:mariner-Tc1 transposon family protein [Penicillium argentinense]|uniref:Mariner-Tc1 transposon family protein n=1 Tax=Penicillium argentinense TaxID=1131581 RepID=A0A9W9G3J9_9EURO|nr:mariner-Tc1 transposon family protein [Penicillium argentinense]KAJ5111402.1 mariner-Tc1 transposon family protein [Penicillium argentinense]